MKGLQPTDFAAFFRQVYDGKDPFPWQERLARRTCQGSWPRCLAVPTAAGKTACIDIAVFALAYQASLPPECRTAPRRVLFVVDRRVVVDQAFEHARTLAAKLADACEGPVQSVADALHQLGADPRRPLDVYSLRGGLYRETAWVRSPLQPTVLTSTVDQVGSRLLFRGYGVTDSCKPLHAALLGNDALILLDEAHCARPFDQTMSLVDTYRRWADAPLASPFQFVTMSATPLSELSEAQIERLGADDLIHPVLGRRMRACKTTRLVIAEKAKGTKGRDELVKVLVQQALSLQQDGAEALGVIVNRVATARQTAGALRRRLGDQANIVLLTGRMRPLDRDTIMGRIEPLLCGANKPLDKPTFVVATQCLEVGADVDFHALVTECASLDSLRQRFGRLNRIAVREHAPAAIVVRADQADPAATEAAVDPVYGKSLTATWQWLNRSKDGVDAGGDAWIDFGVEAMNGKWNDTDVEVRNALLAPAQDAAVLLPAHLDAWCQTAPKPMPDPDPAVFLHGRESSAPEVQVVFRADLGDDENLWAEIAELCPPSSSETLPVRLAMFRSWLRGEQIDDDSSDVEGDSNHGADAESDRPEAPAKRRALQWKGPGARETGIIDALSPVTPGEVYILPASSDAALLGDFPFDERGVSKALDLGDQAYLQSRDRAVLRLRHELYPALNRSADTFDVSRLEPDELESRVQELLALLRAEPDDMVQRAADHLASKRNRIVKAHPLGGLVLLGRRRLQVFDRFAESEESWDTGGARPYLLTDHGRHVAARGSSFARQSGAAALSRVIELAGLFHDTGKADPRFQAWLHSGSRRAADIYPHLLAKSIVPMPTSHDRVETRKRSEYPEGGRHELLSVRFAETHRALLRELDESDRELVLHLIAAHHGFCRPFAPVVEDPCPVEVTFHHDGLPVQAFSNAGLERLDSGVAERFWRLTRRFGWWGLPWLEAMLRLADWACSESPPEEELLGTSSEGASSAVAARGATR